MKPRRKGFPVNRLVTALALAWTMAIGVYATGGPARSMSKGRVSAHAAPPPSTAPASAQANGFVGDDTCTTCHDSEGKSLKGTLHGKSQNARTPAAKTGQACETCHGPGQKHVDSGKPEDIKVFTAMSAKDVSATCLTCHNKGSHAQWNGGMHARNVSCATSATCTARESKHAQRRR